MKVFELMSVLQDCPAGAEVEVHQLITINDLIKGGVENNIEGKDYYSYNAVVTDVSDAPEDGSGRIYLYTD